MERKKLKLPYFQKLEDSKRKLKKFYEYSDNYNFVLIKVSDLIDIRNDLVDVREKMVDLITIYKNRLQKCIKVQFKEPKKRTKEKTTIPSFKPRCKRVSLYPKLITIIQAFDIKLRNLVNTRTSYKRRKRQFKSSVNIKFMNSNFKRFIHILEDVQYTINCHLMFFIHEFERINPNCIDEIQYIKNCGN